jgi:hypothetical protein
MLTKRLMNLRWLPLTPPVVLGTLQVSSGNKVMLQSVKKEVEFCQNGIDKN